VCETGGEVEHFSLGPLNEVKHFKSPLLAFRKRGKDNHWIAKDAERLTGNVCVELQTLCKVLTSQSNLHKDDGFEEHFLVVVGVNGLALQVNRNKRAVFK
jgi:hypothetical protein